METCLKRQCICVCETNMNKMCIYIIIINIILSVCVCVDIHILHICVFRFIYMCLYVLCIQCVCICVLLCIYIVCIYMWIVLHVYVWGSRHSVIRFFSYKHTQPRTHKHNYENNPFCATWRNHSSQPNTSRFFPVAFFCCCCCCWALPAKIKQTSHIRLQSWGFGYTGTLARVRVYILCWTQLRRRFSSNVE